MSFKISRSETRASIRTLEDTTWVTSDVPYRALRKDVEDYLQRLYPRVHDTRKNLIIQKYKIEV